MEIRQVEGNFFSLQAQKEKKIDKSSLSSYQELFEKYVNWDKKDSSAQEEIQVLYERIKEGQVPDLPWFIDKDLCGEQSTPSHFAEKISEICGDQLKIAVLKVYAESGRLGPTIEALEKHYGADTIVEHLILSNKTEKNYLEFLVKVLSVYAKFETHHEQFSKILLKHLASIPYGKRTESFLQIIHSSKEEIFQNDQFDELIQVLIDLADCSEFTKKRVFFSIWKSFDSNWLIENLDLLIKKLGLTHSTDRILEQLILQKERGRDYADFVANLLISYARMTFSKEKFSTALLKFFKTIPYGEKTKTFIQVCRQCTRFLFQIQDLDEVMAELKDLRDCSEFTRKEALFFIWKNFSSLSVIEHYPNFYVKDDELILGLIQANLRSKSLKLPQEINIQDKERLKELGRKYLEKHPSCAYDCDKWGLKYSDYPQGFKGLDKEKILHEMWRGFDGEEYWSWLAYPERLESDAEFILEKLFQWCEKYTPDFLEEFKKCFQKAKTNHAKASLLSSLSKAPLYLYYFSMLSDKAPLQRVIIDSGLLYSIASFRSPEKRSQMLQNFFHSALEEKWVNEYDQLLARYGKRSSCKRTWGPLFLAFVAKISLELNAEAKKKLVDSFDSLFPAKGGIKDADKYKILIECMHEFSRGKPSVELAECISYIGNSLVKNLNKKQKEKAFIEEFKALHCLLLFGNRGSHHLKKILLEEKRFSQVLLGKLDIGDLDWPTDKLLNALEKTFAQGRDPQAIFNYQATVLTEGSTEDQKCLQKYINSVLKGTYHEMRYDVSSNLHMSRFKELAPQKFEKWKKGEMNVRLEELVADTDYPNYLVSDTDDALTALHIGDDFSTCQRTTGEYSLNKGLLAYLTDGKIRFIVVRKKEGSKERMLARCIIRVLFLDGVYPVIHREDIYCNDVSGIADLQKAINKMAMRKAHQLGLELYASKMFENEKYDTNLRQSLYSMKGVAPWEYVDSVTMCPQKNQVYHFRAYEIRT
ncbi:MAG: hypothetical protein CMO81_09760 [Waddliaceae bacterium]|nr:hypothetical protein [Waddliaceae bacterium]